MLDLFGARAGIVCAVGAGGKKTTLYRLAAAHPGRIAQTASVVTPHFPDDLGARVIVDEGVDLLAKLAAASEDRYLAYAAPGEKPGRYGSVPADQIALIHTRCGFDVTFVKADGARMRWLKAPRTGEPILPPGCTTVLMLASARAIGEPLSERTAHRIERVCAVTGARPGEVVTPAHVGRLFSSPDGLLRGLGDARVIPVINMVDDAAGEALAREAARIALVSTDRYDRFILCSMRRAQDPIVAVIE